MVIDAATLLHCPTAELTLSSPWAPSTGDLGVCQGLSITCINTNVDFICAAAEYMDAIVSSVDLKQVDNPDSSLPDLPILLSVESEGVPSIEGLPHLDEAYDLRITDMGIAIRANNAHGLFNGVISLLQLLPPCAPMNDDIKLECMEASLPSSQCLLIFTCMKHMFK